MDYNIKIKGEGIGKAATEARKKVLQAQKKFDKKPEAPKSPFDTNKSLISSNQKLISSNKSLEKSISSGFKIQKEKITPQAKETVEKIKEKITPQARETVEKIKEKITPQAKETVEKIKEKITPQAKETVEKIKEKITPQLKKSITAETKLINSLDNLIKINKDLIKTIQNDIRKRGGKITGAGATAAGATAAGGAGIGGIGASIPILGAGIAALGFTIQKINQIGNAYIELSSQQLRTVGMGGFRRGQGIYGATEMGAGMAAFARGTGRFAENIETTEEQIKAPLAIGTRYGMSAEQILGQAGTFRRAGGKIEETAAIAAGGGIQADMPVLLSGMAGVLEESIRNGIDTTNMAKDLGTGLTRLAMETPAKSAEAALSIIRSFQGVKQGVRQGKLAGFEQMYVAGAGRDILMEKLQNPDIEQRTKYLQSLTESGWISERQRKEIERMKPGESYQDLTKRIGVAAAQQLTQKTVGGTQDVELMTKVIQNVQKTWGKGTEARQQFQTIAQSMGWSTTAEQMVPLWNLAGKDLPKSEYVKQMKEIGMKETQKGAAAVEKGEAGIGAQRRIQRQNLILSEAGNKFAKASYQMETAMISFAKNAIPAVTTAMDGLGEGLNILVTGVNNLIKIIKKMDTMKDTGLYIW